MINVSSQVISVEDLVEQIDYKSIFLGVHKWEIEEFFNKASRKYAIDGLELQYDEDEAILTGADSKNYMLKNGTTLSCIMLNWIDTVHKLSDETYTISMGEDYVIIKPIV